MKHKAIKLRIGAATILIGFIMVIVSAFSVKGQDTTPAVDSRTIAQNVRTDKISEKTVSDEKRVKINSELKSDRPGSGIFEEAKEESIKLEDWMLEANNEYWRPVVEELEDDIELEDWMLDLSLWQ